MYSFFGLPNLDQNKLEQFKSDAKTVGNYHLVNVHSDGIGYGNLDMMLSSIDRLKKQEIYCEQFLKRLEKNSTELDPQYQSHNLKIDTPLGPRDISTYLKKFEWDLSRFSKGQTLSNLIGVITERIE